MRSGLAGTSTTAVSERAGVSQGGLFKHFPTKTELLCAALEALLAELLEDFRRAYRGIAAGEDRVTAALQVLWGVFRQPRLQAAFELYAAARTDPQLRASLAPVLASYRRELRAEARALFPRSALRNPHFDAVAQAVIDAAQGAALGDLVLQDPEAQEQRLRQLERWVRGELVEEERGGHSCRP